MPNPTEVCVLTINGKRYDMWETVEFHRKASEAAVDRATLTVAEFSDRGKQALQILPDDEATLILAGQPVIVGKVYLRQASIEANSHVVQVSVCSNTIAMHRSTMGPKEAEWKGTAQQIASGVLKVNGLGFRIAGLPPGADQAFKKIRSMVGEPRFSFIERVLRMRNLRMRDDLGKGVVAFREAEGVENNSLVEGKNILRGRLTLQTSDQPSSFTGLGHENGSAATAAAKAMRTDDNKSPYYFVAEDAADKLSIQMRVDHQVAWSQMTQVEGVITVAGWLKPDGDLWANSVNKAITLDAPSLLPGGSDATHFEIDQVVHRQSIQDGTTTDIVLRRSYTMHNGQVAPGGGSSPAFKKDGLTALPPVQPAQAFEEGYPDSNSSSVKGPR